MRKTALIRLVKLSKNPTQQADQEEGNKVVAKVVAEVQIDLSQHVGQGDLQIVYPFLSQSKPVNISVDTTIQVDQMVKDKPELDLSDNDPHSPLISKPQKRKVMTTYKGGT